MNCRCGSPIDDPNVDCKWCRLILQYEVLAPEIVRCQQVFSFSFTKKLCELVKYSNWVIRTHLAHAEKIVETHMMLSESQAPKLTSQITEKLGYPFHEEEKSNQETEGQEGQEEVHPQDLGEGEEPQRTSKKW